MAQVINSKDNQLIKLASSLNEKKYRKLHALALLEGVKIIDEAIKTNQIFYKLFIDENKTEEYKNYLHQVECEVVYVNSKLIETISPSQTPQGVVAIIKTRSFEPMVIGGNFLVLDNVQDPGNLGTIIRTADWFGIQNIVCSESCVDIYNPKVVQATMGSIFRLNVLVTSLADFFKENNQLCVYGALLEGENCFATRFQQSHLVLLMGNEGAGISPKLFPYITKKITIPKLGHAESLNVGIATGILCAEMTK